MQNRASRRPTDSQKSPDLYLKLASLEIERSRRVAELDALAERMNKTSQRVRLISEEQETLRRRILAMTQDVPLEAVSQPTQPSQANNSMGFTY
jgi:hypothetical protein